MKNVMKFLILVAILAVIGFVGWHFIKPTLFAPSAEGPNAELSASDDTAAPASQQSEPLSDEQAFSSTTDTNAPSEEVSSEHFDCRQAARVISQLYDQYAGGKSPQEMETWVKDNPAIPDDQVEGFTKVIANLSQTEPKKLPHKNKVLSRFASQCKSSG